MQKFVFCFCLLILGQQSFAQNDCGTKMPLTPLLVDSALVSQRSPQLTSPYLIKLFVYVFANDNGTGRAAPDTAILRQLENMRQFYAPHDICFVLGGIEQINSSDLNDHKADVEEADLTPFLVPDAITIFIHSILFNDDGGLNGIAYGIPNSYMSVSGNAISSASNRSTTAHEMGHCFGLYHTFATGFGTENIPRTGLCVNCNTAGDLICDTQADPHSDNYDTDNVITTNCIFTGTLTQSCAGNTYTYNMNPHNVMAYGRRACRDLFTSGQGNRARAIIVTTNFLTDAIAPDNNNISTSQTINSGLRVFTARNFITVNAANFTTGSSSQVNISSAAGVDLKPGVTLAPTAGNGYARVMAVPLCF
jgi:hypothetical protein